jgi:diguanylate cyclase (GGDEF)-like protein
VILLKGAEAERAPEFAEQIRAAIADHEILDYTAGSRLQVTVSLGVACYELGQGKSRLVARADEALYLSKREGRNRVSVG